MCMYAHGGKNHLILDDRPAQEPRIASFIHLRSASVALSPTSSPAIRVDLLFLVNLDRLRIDDSPKEPALLHLDLVSMFFFPTSTTDSLVFKRWLDIFANTRIDSSRY